MIHSCFNIFKCAVEPQKSAMKFDDAIAKRVQYTTRATAIMLGEYFPHFLD